MPTSQTSVLNSLAPSLPTPGQLAAGTVSQAGAQAGGQQAASTPTDQNPGLPEWAGGKPSHPQMQGQQPQDQPQQAPSWSNIGGAIPSGLYQGIARLPNLPTNAINMALNTGRNFGLPLPEGNLQPPINENPTNYQPVGPIASNLENATDALGTTLAMGGVGKLAAAALPSASVPQAVARAVGTTPPSVLAAATAGGAVQEPIANQVPDEWKPMARMAANLGAGAGIAGVEGATGRAFGGGIGPETAQLAQMARDQSRNTHQGWSDQRQPHDQVC